MNFRSSLLLAAALLAACDGSVDDNDDRPGEAGGGGGSGGEGGGGPGPSCDVPAPGKPFEIRVRNERATTITLPQGCSTDPPVTLEVGAEKVGIGAEYGNACGFSCEPILEGKEPPGGCSDCGPGTFTQIQAGQTAKFTWNRYVWTAGTASADCSGLSTDYECAMPGSIGAKTYPGALWICADGAATGGCSGDEESISFQIDLATDSVEIVIPP